MLKNKIKRILVQAYRALFVAAFVALNLVGIMFLGVVGYYLIF